MKTTLFFVSAALLLIALSEASISPLESDDAAPVLKRFRRFTCDALSFEVGTVKVNHAACALHCVALQFRGGYCNSQAVCVCRK